MGIDAWKTDEPASDHRASPQVILTLCGLVITVTGFSGGNVIKAGSTSSNEHEIALYARTFAKSGYSADAQKTLSAGVRRKAEAAIRGRAVLWCMGLGRQGCVRITQHFRRQFDTGLIC